MSLAPILDTSQGHSAIPFKHLSFIKKRLHDLQLIDVWRSLHPKVKDYSYSSKTHDSIQELITYVLITFTSLFCIQPPYLGNASIFDHIPPVSICLTIPTLPPRTNNWKPDSLLSNPMDASILSTSLMQYFTENESPETAPSLLWEAHKARMRDRLMELGEKKRGHGKTLQISLHKSHLEALVLKREELKALFELDTKNTFNLVSQSIYE